MPTISTCADACDHKAQLTGYLLTVWNWSTLPFSYLGALWPKITHNTEGCFSRPAPARINIEDNAQAASANLSSFSNFDVHLCFFSRATIRWLQMRSTVLIRSITSDTLLLPLSFSETSMRTMLSVD